MKVLHKICCGLDVHQAVIVACLFVERNGKTTKVFRQFSTVAKGLKELATWLKSSECTLVAMEGTGVYWVPIYNALEGYVPLLVANALHIKNVPGRKTDMKDAEWIGELARHGLLQPSFIPPRPIRLLRELTRFRKKLVESANTERNRLIKVLENTGIKLATFLSDVFGVSGRLMIEALVADNMDPAQMAALAKGTLKRKAADIEDALVAELAPSSRYLVKTIYGRIQKTEEQIGALDKEIEQHLTPYQAAFRLLLSIPGIDRIVAAAVIGEIGADVAAFRHAKALSNWLGVCPGNYRSAGKRKGGRTNPGNRFLKSMLVEAAWGAVRAEGYLRQKYYKLKARRGAKKAIMAIAHKLAVAIYHVLKKGQPYNDLGEQYLDKLKRSATTLRLVRRLEALGYKVTKPVATITAPLQAATATPSTQPKKRTTRQPPQRTPPRRPRVAKQRH
jgi:transposase